MGLGRRVVDAGPRPLSDLLVAIDAQLEGRLWRRISVEDPRGRELADRHYSRQKVGARGYMPPGQRIALWTPGAIWGACYNVDPLGTWRWRNTIFRNESPWLTSALVLTATWTTYDEWELEYGKLLEEKLTTEVDVDATADRRSRSARPGRCYEAAGWSFVEIRQRAKRKQRHAILTAPDPALRFDR